MTKLIQVLIFLLAFQMEIRVKASNNSTQQQFDCINSQNSCSVQAATGGLHFQQANLSLHATESTVLSRLSGDLWRFVKGTVWIEKADNVSFETVYGNLTAKQGQYWIIEGDTTLLIRNMNADLKILFRDGKSLSLPEGFEVWISGVNSKGTSEFGMIQPINMKDHLPLWNSLYRGSKSDFINQVMNFREQWGDITDKSSALYKELAVRKIASIREQKEKDRLRAQHLNSEKMKIKNLYYQKVFER